MTTIALILCAILAATLALGAWLTLRQDPATVRVAVLPPTPRTGPAPAELPPAGAGPTPEHPTPTARAGQPARSVPGHK